MLIRILTSQTGTWVPMRNHQRCTSIRVPLFDWAIKIKMMDGQSDGWTIRHMDNETDGQSDGWMDKRIERQTN